MMATTVPNLLLKLYVRESNTDLCRLYAEHIVRHNTKIQTSRYPDAGFDLFVPEHTTFERYQGMQTQYVDLGVQAEMVIRGGDGETPTAFDLVPRSSISKTPLMLANHVGIIDAGYRGFLVAALRNLSGEPYRVEKHTRLVQICHGSRAPITVQLVKEGDLSSTERGDGGFGSTGA